MKKIVAFGASNSSKSINKRLATYTVQQVPEVERIILDLNDFDLPLFGVDLEASEGIPNEAHEFLAHIKSADGLIISFAEHNGAYTTAFKNLFDWMSRIDGNLWSEVPMLAMATSPGKRGGASVLEIAKSRFKFMGGNIVSSFSLPSFNDHFDSDKGILDQELNKSFRKALETFQKEVLKD